ncbi:sulfotransferase [Thermomonas sp. S9]|uniref:tetratricopeptide repeat-containing sulfotransferase family protein n=1 Tax=Thermomonas sp. S9 TaxID=2885203 RepID=UPI00216B13BA|nr:tetratricopeptide repeat-containing sulfotransferase family protein [Thermomonas sp. S9]MCR6495826.1 sulfotransferase [Thermomonas sp. S9]
METPPQIYARAVDALNRGDWARASALAESLLPKIPPHAGVYFVAGVAALQMQRLREGIRHLQRAVHHNPGRPDYAAQFARGLAMARLTRESVVAADAALAMGPQDAATLDTLAVVYTQANEHAKAARLFELAVQRVPGRAVSHFNLATSLMFIGQMERAGHEYEACIAADPTFWKAHLALAQLCKATPEHNHLDRLRGLLERADGGEARMYLNLALAKELEDLGDYPCAFSHLAAGKAAGGEARGYSSARDAALFDTLRGLFPAPGDSGGGDPDPSPIFVVGMPRSGTTLVDRILSSHPQVHSAGELQNFGVVLKRLSGSPTPELLDAETLRRGAAVEPRRLGETYVASTRPGTAVRPRFVDKLPHNFLYLGHIARALPNARIVCLRRNPMDTCLGNFRQLFAQTSPYYDYSFDLLDTGRYYLQFDALMRHWQQVLPGRVLEMHYEALVDDQEGQTRHLLAHCGLEWDPACLRFADNAAPVATASAVQVREPLHRQALARWKRYGSALDDLRALLEDGGVHIE